MKNKKVLLISSLFFCSEFQSVSRIVKIVHSALVAGHVFVPPQHLLWISTVMCCCPCPSKVEALFEYVSIFVLDVSPHALRTEESACTFFQSIVSDSDPQEEQNFFRHACVIHIYELFFNLKSDFDALQLFVS